MRISDWSSDVGSSDLTALDELGSGHLHPPLLRSRIGSAAAHYPVGASQGQAERCVALGECVEHVRKVHELLHDDMDDLTFALDLAINRSEEHTSELPSLMRISYAVFCLKKKNKRHKKI